MLAKDYAKAGPNETPCICGRSPSVQHCPKCGSISCYGLARKSKRNIVNEVTGKAEHREFLAFRCRRCGTLYDEYDWQNNCQATPIKEFDDRLIANSKPVNEAFAKMGAAVVNAQTPEEKRIAFADMLAKSEHLKGRSK